MQLAVMELLNGRSRRMLVQKASFIAIEMRLEGEQIKFNFRSWLDFEDFSRKFRNFLG
jgi:hypothetical protein